MGFATLALISAVAVLGPLLALPARWRLPVLFGELIAGLLLGKGGVGVLDAADPTFAFLANIGFALVMFVAATHVPVRDPRLRDGVRLGAMRAIAVGVISAPAGIVIAIGFHTGHAALYAVLLASSSAALALPMIDSLRLRGGDRLQVLSQIAIADALCVVAVPLVIDPSHAGRAALGAAAIVVSVIVLFFVLRQLERSGARKRFHQLSERHKFALELRYNLVILFALAALAVRTHVSVLLAGFGYGLAVAAVGEPRRLARQLFALTEGFLGPLFFVWLGASINIRSLATHPSFALLGIVLGVSAVLVHLSMRVTGQPLAVGGLAAVQLGVPLAAATIGVQEHLLKPGEDTALILGALVTFAFALACAINLARSSSRTPAPAADDRPQQDSPR